MRSDVALFITSVSAVAIVALIVRFHTGSSQFAGATLGGINNLYSTLLNPGRYEQGVQG